MGRPVPLWWLQISDGYLRSVARRGRRPNTLRAYRFELDDFGSWLQAHEVAELRALLRAHVEAWQDDLRERKALPTQMVAAAAIRGLLKWAADQELALSSPTLWLRVASPKVPPGVPRPIPARDLATLRHALTPAEPTDVWRLRTRALFWVTYSSGGRVSEALSLLRHSLSDGAALVIQKGGRAHTLVISATARQAILDYEDHRTDSSKFLFASLRPGRLNDPLGWEETQEGWDRLGRELGISRFTTHQIRHSCGTSMRRRGVDIVLIARHLGHRGLRTVMGYLEIELDDRVRAVALLDEVLVG